jgi:hypothetical protein
MEMHCLQQKIRSRGTKEGYSENLTVQKLPEEYTVLPISSMPALVPMSRTDFPPRYHEQTFLMSELESLGLSSIKLNEFNDNVELKRLVNAIKEDLLAEYRRSIK